MSWKCAYDCFAVLQIKFEFLKFSSIFIIRLSSDGAYYGIVMSVRPSLRPSIRPGLRPSVFRTFLRHALTYLAEILHMTLFKCTTDQHLASIIEGVIPLLNLEYKK